MPIAAKCRPHFTPALLLSLTCGLLPGCGGDSGRLPTVRVSGTLTVDAKPASKGSVHFQPEKGPAATGVIEAGGKFTLSTYSDGDGVVPGKNRISVEVVEEVPTKDGDTKAKSLIPAKFMNLDDSGLQLDVPPGGYANLQISITADKGAIKED